MKRSNAWYLAVFFVAGCGGGSGEAEMAETGEAEAEMEPKWPRPKWCLPN